MRAEKTRAGRFAIKRYSCYVGIAVTRILEYLSHGDVAVQDDGSSKLIHAERPREDLSALVLGQKGEGDRDVDSRGVVPTLDDLHDDRIDPEDTCAELQVYKPDHDAPLGEKHIGKQGGGFTGLVCGEVDILESLCEESGPGAPEREVQHDGDTIIIQQLEGSIPVESLQKRPREEPVKSIVNGAAIDGCTTSYDTCRRLGTDEYHEASSCQMQDEDDAHNCMSPRKRSKRDWEAGAQRTVLFGFRVPCQCRNKCLFGRGKQGHGRERSNMQPKSRSG